MNHCDGCGKHIAKVAVVPWHEYYFPGEKEARRATCGHQETKHYCYLCSEGQMDWDAGDMGTLCEMHDRELSTLGKDERHPELTLEDMDRRNHVCDDCGVNFGLVEVIKEVKFRVHGLTSSANMIPPVRHVCFHCAGLAGWRDLGENDIPVPEDWLKTCAQQLVSEKAAAAARRADLIAHGIDPDNVPF